MRTERFVIDLGRDLDRRPWTRTQRCERPIDPLRYQLAVALDVAMHVDERLAMARQREPRIETIDVIQGDQELLHRVGCIAVVEVERDPPQHVIAGDQQPALGLEQAHVRGRVPGRLVDGPGSEVGLDLDPSKQFTVWLDHARDARRQILDLVRQGADRRLRNAALTRDLEPASDRLLGSVGATVLEPPVHQELAPGPVADRSRLAPVV